MVTFLMQIIVPKRWLYFYSSTVRVSLQYKKVYKLNHPSPDRSVESSAIKRAIENVYAPLLPKGGSPFIYLSLEIDPANVDVNVHPTKKEVHFLNEERIIQAICEEFDKKLESANSSRTFHTQALFPGAKPVEEAPAESSNPTRVDYKLIRTDNRATTLDRFIQKPQTKKVRLEESDDENDRMDVDSQEE